MRSSGLQDRLVLVTGAAGGIGRAVVEAFLAEGARVVATDLDVSAFAPTDRLHPRVLDVADPRAVTAMVAEIEAQLGPIQAGISVAGVLFTGRVADTADADWHRVFAVNTHGVFHFGRALAAPMTARRSGTLVVVGSNAAGVPRHAMAAYAASKAASAMFTRCRGWNSRRSGSAPDTVAPGSTLTPMQTGMWADGDGARQVIAGDPAEFRLGSPSASWPGPRMSRTPSSSSPPTGPPTSPWPISTWTAVRR